MSIKTLIKNLKFLAKNNLWSLKSTSEWADIDNIPTIRKMRFFQEMQQHKILFVKPHILNYQESIDYIIKNKCSICRFGDGEFNMIQGGSCSFQNTNPILSKRLKEILLSCFTPQKAIGNNIKLAVGYNYYNFLDWSNLIIPDFYNDYVTNNEVFLANICNPEYEYLATEISQLYHIIKDYDFAAYFEHIKEIWKNRDTVIICGDRIFNKIKHNIFDCAKSIEYIYAPTTEAFEQYEQILEKASVISKDKLIIIILGPTATILAWDLSQLGYQALDFGHIAKDYDAFIKQKHRSISDIQEFFDKD